MEILEHFYVKVIVPIEVFGIDISITNLTISLIGAAVLFLAFFVLLALRPKIIPGKGQVAIEMLVNFIKRNIVYNMIGKKEGDRWFPLIGGIFIFVLSCSLIGIIPGLYTPAANPIVNITLAAVVFLTVQISCIAKTGIKGFVRSFAPKAVPSWMYVIVVPIEIISAISKPFSLFIRLTANMLAGLTIIYVILGLILYFESYLIAVAAYPFAVVMTLFKIFVAVIQAYIFAVLSALYIGEAVKPKH